MFIAKKKNRSNAGLMPLLVMVLLLMFALNAPLLWSEEKPQMLTLSSWGSEKDVSVATWKVMIKDLEEATNGQIGIKMFHAQALGKAKEHYEIALMRTADLAYLNVGFTPGRFPLTDLAAFAHASSGEILSRGMMAMMEAGCLDKEYGKVKILYTWSSSPSHFVWGKGKKAATTLKDLKGKKIRVPTTGAANLMKELGAIPVAIPMPEVYTAMERGVIDATFTCINTMEVFGLNHVSNEITISDGPGIPFCLLINKESWDELPEQAKEVLEKKARQYALSIGRTHDKSDARCLKNFSPTLYHLSDEDKLIMKQASAKALEEYISKYEGLGFPAMKAARVYYDTLDKEFGQKPFVLPK